MFNKILRTTLLFLLAILTNLCLAQVWSKVAKSPNKGLTDIHFISKSTGFVLSNGTVLTSTDSGKSWNSILTSYTNFTQIHFVDSKYGYIIGANDLILKTDDGGKNWTSKSTGYSDADFNVLFCKTKDSLFVIGYENLDKQDSSVFLSASYNGGSTWSKVDLKTKNSISSMHFWNKNHGIISFLNGSLIQSTNGFNSYTSNSGISHAINDLSSIKDSIILVIGKDGDILRSTNYGKSFKTITSNTTESLYSISFCNDSVGMISGNNGSILYTKDAGLTWTTMHSNTKLSITRVQFKNPYLAWAVSYSLRNDSLDILKFEDKSCISRFVKLPRDTAICNKYTYETPFITSGKNKPTWEINDALTKLYQKNDSVASIVGQHEGKFIISFALQSCDETLLDTAILFVWRNPTISVKDSIHCGSVNDRIMFSCFACQYLWSTNDNTTSIYVTQPGKYWVTVQNHCGKLSDTFNLTYLPYQKLDLGKDTILCNKETLPIKLNLSQGQLIWNDLDTSSIRTIAKSGVYSASFKNKCNQLSDTIRVDYKNSPRLDLGKDSIYCNQMQHLITLDSVKVYSTVKWSDSSENYSRQLVQPGKYFAKIKNECGVAIDSIQLKLSKIPNLNLGKDTTYCQNFVHQIHINPQTEFYKVEWWDKDTSLSRNFSMTGTYSVILSNSCGQKSDSIHIVQKELPKVDLGKDTSLKKPFSLSLNAENQGSHFEWSTGDTSSKIEINDFGKYWVRVSNYCGEDADTIHILDKAGIKDVFGINKIKVFPNPLSDGKLNVHYLGGPFSMSIYNSLGNEVEVKQGYSHSVFDINSLPAGIYILKITTSNNLENYFKLVKQ